MREDIWPDDWKSPTLVPDGGRIFVIHDAEIVTIMPANPGTTTYSNVQENRDDVAGYALVEFVIDYGDGVRRRSRDIVPFDIRGWLLGMPGDSGYLANGLGDGRIDMDISAAAAGRARDDADAHRG